MEAKGFPKPIELLGGNDLNAVDAWLDRQNGLLDAEPDFDTSWMEASSG